MVKPGTGNGEMGNGKWETEMGGNAGANLLVVKKLRCPDCGSPLTALLLLVALAVATGRSTTVTVSRLPVLCSGRELFVRNLLVAKDCAVLTALAVQLP